MKAWGLLLAALFTAPVMAASPYLPVSATNTFASAERGEIEKAIAQAEAEGKYVLIDSAAAWCGPCAALDKAMEEKSAELAPTLSRFVFVHLDEMQFEAIVGEDFLPWDIMFFPSLHAYNPANGKWTFLGGTSGDSIKKELDAYLANPDLAGYYWNAFTDTLTNEKVGSPNDALAISASEVDGATYLARVKVVADLMTSKPEAFEGEVEELQNYVLNSAHRLALAMGKVTLAEVRAVNPGALADFENGGGTTHHLTFAQPISALVHKAGNKAAADQCAAISAQSAIAQAKAKPEMQRLTTLLRDLSCLQLKVQVKEAGSAEVKAYVATMTEAERTSRARELMKLFASTGTDFDSAIEHGRVYQKSYLDNLTKYPDMIARVQEATNARLGAYACGKSHR